MALWLVDLFIGAASLKDSMAVMYLEIEMGIS